MRWGTRWHDAVTPTADCAYCDGTGMADAHNECGFCDWSISPSERWRDPEWRATWLLGLTDDQLNAMSPYQKGHLLPAYVWLGHHAELFGADALNYEDGRTIARLAKLNLGINPSPSVYIALGKAHHLMSKGTKR